MQGNTPFKALPAVFFLTHVYVTSFLSKQRDQENGVNGQERHHSIVLKEAVQNVSPINGSCDSIKGGSH